VDDLRNKRVYTLTDAGRAALEKWMATPTDQPVLKHPVMMRVWLGHLADPERLRELLAEHQASVATLRDDAETAALAADEAYTYPALVNRWAARYYQAELDLAQALLDDLADLDSGALANDSSSDQT
ncbi:MAG: hypothetical protein KDB21_11045, partial [Acidimicrobiales bacterium]|nr:hypothetical protein [Acidimicrobiales bacterium]